MKFYSLLLEKTKAQKIALAASLTALSICLSVYSFPIFPATPFLKLDFADTTLFLTGIFCGPYYALASTLIASTVQSFTTSPTPAHSGLFIHFIITGVTMLFLTYIYRKFFLEYYNIKYIKKEKIDIKKQRKRTLLFICVSFLVCIIIWFSLAFIINYTITPKIYKLTTKDFNAMIPYILAFNVVKYIVNYAIVVLILLRVHISINRVLKKMNN